MTEALYIEVTAKADASRKEHRRVSVSGMLKVLSLSRTGYRAWLHHIPTDSQKRKEAIKAIIKEIHSESHENYGAPKIAKTLQRKGEKISERTVGKYMKEMGIKARWIKHWTITTKDSDFSNKLQNTLDRQFNPKKPNVAWCSDITYLWTQNGFVYLTSIMDLFSRKIVSWTLSDSLSVSSVINTVEKAKARRPTEVPIIIHSDRGKQYVSKEYLRITENMQRSYSHKACPWDNACIESFHAIIKREWLNWFKIQNYEHAHRLVFEYIEAFYNTRRIHGHCEYMSPDNYEKTHLQEQNVSTLLTG